MDDLTLTFDKKQRQKPKDMTPDKIGIDYHPRTKEAMVEIKRVLHNADGTITRYKEHEPLLDSKKNPLDHANPKNKSMNPLSTKIDSTITINGTPMSKEEIDLMLPSTKTNTPSRLFTIKDPKHLINKMTSVNNSKNKTLEKTPYADPRLPKTKTFAQTVEQMIEMSKAWNKTKGSVQNPNNPFNFENICFPEFKLGHQRKIHKLFLETMPLPKMTVSQDMTQVNGLKTFAIEKPEEIQSLEQAKDLGISMITSLRPFSYGIGSGIELEIPWIMSSNFSDMAKISVGLLNKFKILTRLIIPEQERNYEFFISPEKNMALNKSMEILPRNEYMTWLILRFFPIFNLMLLVPYKEWKKIPDPRHLCVCVGPGLIKAWENQVDWVLNSDEIFWYNFFYWAFKYWNRKTLVQKNYEILASKHIYKVSLDKNNYSRILKDLQSQAIRLNGILGNQNLWNELFYADLVLQASKIKTQDLNTQKEDPIFEAFLNYSPKILDHYKSEIRSIHNEHEYQTVFTNIL